MDSEQTLREIRDRISTARQREAQAEVARANALRERETVAKLLKEEFGVDTYDDGALLLKKLKKSQDSLLSKIQEGLEELER